VPEPFLVLATQNPIESEGVYQLPEAQRDRFLMKVQVDYPSPAEEVEIVHRMGVVPPEAKQVLTPQELIGLQQAAREVYVDRGVVDYAVNLVLATRSPKDFGLAEIAPLIEYGASPRASLGLVSAGRALALLRGRRYAVPQDVFDVAPEILRHRLVLSYEALAQGLVVDQITARILSTVPAPRVTPILEGMDGSGRTRPGGGEGAGPIPMPAPGADTSGGSPWAPAATATPDAAMAPSMPAAAAPPPSGPAGSAGH
jgi:MoxR-like ATPase